MRFSPWDNPMGTDGFEFIEYAAPDPVAMGALFERMGFRPIARHRHKAVTLYRQGEINFIVNAEPDSFAQRFARLHGPSICAIAFRVQDTRRAYERAQSLGAWAYAGTAGPGELNIPAIKGIGDSLIYLVDRWRGKGGAQAGAIGLKPMRTNNSPIACGSGAAYSMNSKPAVPIGLSHRSSVMAPSPE